MSYAEAREKVVRRVRKELIGPGSDIFVTDEEYLGEIIEGKPLTRYFSGILFPRKKSLYLDGTGENEYSDEGIDRSEDNSDTEAPQESETDSSEERSGFEEPQSEENTLKLKGNQYFPSTAGITFCLPTHVNSLNLIISFGTYEQVNSQRLNLHYDGQEIDLIERFGFHEWIEYDEDNQTLSLIKPIKGGEQRIYDLLNQLRSADDGKYRYHSFTRHLEKLFRRKTKYQRINHTYTIDNFDVVEIHDQKLSQLVECRLPSNLKEGIRIHTRLFEFSDHKYFKIVVENKSNRPTKNGEPFDDKTLVLSKEALNKSCLFQFELKIEAEEILPYRKDYENKDLPPEEQTLNFLYRNIKSYAIGHGIAAEWDESDNPKWVKTTYFPQYDLRNQTTDVEGMGDLLKIKDLSTFSDLTRDNICNNLESFANKYEEWIGDRRTENAGQDIGERNLDKCEEVLNRMKAGIQTLRDNDLAFQAFQFANSAIYMQMFHTAKYFDVNKGYERYEWNFGEMPEYEEYRTLPYPNRRIPKWRPFQLAFFLLSIPSYTNPESTVRKLVDLIWFPTGGGKTEAYLAVSAFLIFYRRLKYSDSYGGVNIIMRYTLRLLTAQQFERASKLIFACEKIRKAHLSALGDERISIGFWVGDQMIRNKAVKAKKELTKIINQLNQGRNADNKFQISICQWCNTKTITKLNEQDKELKFSFREGTHKLSIRAGCNNPECDYYERKDGMPLVLVDDDIYNNPPTILFGTVDKFARLAWEENARKLFNRHNKNRPPELIIQDELHLLSGPLGSITGLFENVILELCKHDDIVPKVITSTATVKNVHSQVQALYGREVSIFPPYGIDVSDSFFARTAEDSKRRYIGILPTGKTSMMTQLRLLAALLFGRSEIADTQESDHFWTILSYYNSLKEVGKMANRINSELHPEQVQLFQRMIKGRVWPPRYRELTSRIQSSRVKENLDALAFGIGNTDNKNRPLDLALATNMISVGLDIGRLGVMVINGMPRNIAEYIQSSSRVARKNEGMVFALLNPDNSRDLSIFEHFIPFHQTFYKQVEPLSLTPFTDNTFDMLLFTMLVAFYRNRMDQYQNEKAAEMDTQILMNEFLAAIQDHPFLKDVQRKVLEGKIETILKKWEDRISGTPEGLRFKTNQPNRTLLRTAQNKQNEDDLIAMHSMRNVEPVCRIQINQY